MRKYDRTLVRQAIEDARELRRGKKTSVFMLIWRNGPRQAERQPRQGLSFLHKTEFGEELGDFEGVFSEGGGDVLHAFGPQAGD